MEQQLIDAIVCNEVERVEKLLKDGADPNTVNKYGRTPISMLLDIECDIDIEKMFQLLLEHGADPNLGERSLLYDTLSIWGTKGCFELLLKHGATKFDRSCISNDENPERYPDLLHVVANCDVDGIGLLLDYGYNPNTQDSNGNTVLHKMSIYVNPSIKKKLLQCGANPNIKNKEGKVPLDMIDTELLKCIQSIETILLLVKYGAVPSESFIERIAKKKCIDALVAINLNKDEINDEIDSTRIYYKFNKNTLPKYNNIAKFINYMK